MDLSCLEPKKARDLSSKMTWHSHKPFLQWLHSFHLKAVQPLAKRLMPACYYCSKTGSSVLYDSYCPSLWPRYGLTSPLPSQWLVFMYNVISQCDVFRSFCWHGEFPWLQHPHTVTSQECHYISNHQQLDCFFSKSLLRLTTKKKIKDPYYWASDQWFNPLTKD